MLGFMKKIYITIIIVLVLLIIVLLLDKFYTPKWIPPQIDDNELTKVDRNQDGEIDSWIYRNEEGIPSIGIIDQNYNGDPDSWAFFKNGKAFLDEEDSDGDGKIDKIFLHVFSEDKNKIREFFFDLLDKKRNIFVEKEDTGWVDVTK